MSKRLKRTSPLSRILSAHLQERGLSNRAAAKIANVSPTSIQDWKNGVTPTDFEAIARLADWLEVPLRYLLTGQVEDGQEGRKFFASEVLADEGEIFSGICQVNIRRLVWSPRMVAINQGE